MMKGVKIFFVTFVLFCASIKADEGEKIIGGQDATQGQFPYQVSWCEDVYPLLGPAYCFTNCGGSIYNELTIITAAHCCEGVSATKIVAGELDVINESGQEQIRTIKKKKQHPQYNPTVSMANDICLLILDIPLNLNDQVKAIGLDTVGPTDGAKCKVSGWGTQTVCIKYLSQVNHLISTIFTGGS